MNNNTPQDPLLNMDEVCKKIRVSRTTLFEIRRNPYGGFPKPVDYGSKKLLWLESDLDKWVWKQLRKASKKPQDQALDESLASLGNGL